MDRKQIFALDIGTRKIVGLVMERNGNQYQVLGSEMREHQTRAMMDGQIHDVEAVASTIQEIKEALESRLEMRLNAAAVAAAGRSLKTAQGYSKQRRPPTDEISREEVTALELAAVQDAQLRLAEEDQVSPDRSTYFCVGFSVVYYHLEGQNLGSLVGQVGAEIGIEVIATFLPRVVVDSLFSSLKRADLSVESLTLEPIAALSVAIPGNMRMLNLALVDIGAGTSDIAVVRSGNVFAYAMVPIGGDEITEKLAGHYLLDFLSAESVKRQLQTGEDICFEDILGNPWQLSTAAIGQVLEPTIRELTGAVAEQILSLNQKVPDAVMCVGGGSLTINLIGMLARDLNLPENRVGIRTPETFAHITVDSDYLKGPQGVTPLGIAYHSLSMPVVPFIKVIVNEREVPLWNMGHLTVAAGLLSSGISLANIYGKPGLGKTLEINGRIQIFRGELGTPPYIEVNGEEAALDTVIHDEDRITFRRGTDGHDVHLCIGDLIPPSQGSAWVNGEEIKLEPWVKVNGLVWDQEQEIPDRAKVEYREAPQLKNVLLKAGVPEDMLEEKLYRYVLNGQQGVCRWQPVHIEVEGQPRSMADMISPGERVEYRFVSDVPRLRDLQPQTEWLRLRIKVNGDPVEVTSRDVHLLMNGQKADLDTVLMDNAQIEIDQSQSQAILSDIFRVVEIKPLPYGRLTIRVNGQNAGFTTPITEGSEIELRWEA